MRCFRDSDCVTKGLWCPPKMEPKCMHKAICKCVRKKQIIGWREHDFVFVLDWREHANILFQEFSNNYDFVL
jgi:hypothetical protein